MSRMLATVLPMNARFRTASLSPLDSPLDVNLPWFGLPFPRSFIVRGFEGLEMSPAPSAPLFPSLHGRHHLLGHLG